MEYSKMLPKNTIDFSQNTNHNKIPIDTNSEILNNTYDGDDLNVKMAEINNISIDFVISANGTSNILMNLVSTIKPKKALIIVPTTSNYENILKGANCEIKYYYLSVLNGFHLTVDFLEEINETYDAIIISNPNDPTGQIISKKLMSDIMLTCKKYNVFFIVDESNIDFTDDPVNTSMITLINGNKNLFVIRTLKNMFYEIDLDVSFGFCSNIKLLNIMKNLKTLGQINEDIYTNAIVAISDSNYMNNARKTNRINKEYLLTNLTKLGLYIIGSQSNYILFINETTINIITQLQKNGIVIKDCSDIHGLDEKYFKLFVKSKEDNQKLILALINILVK